MMNTVISCVTHTNDLEHSKYIQCQLLSENHTQYIYNGSNHANYHISYSNNTANSVYDSRNDETKDDVHLPLYQLRHNKMMTILHEYETLPLYLVTGFIREIGIIIPQDLINLCFKFYQRKEIAQLIDSKDSDQLYTISWEATENEDYLFAEQLIGYLTKKNKESIKKNKIKAINDKNASTTNLMAVIQYFLRDYKSSEKYFVMASSIDPKCDVIMNNYAVLLLEQGRFEDAEEQIISAIKCNPECIKNHQQYAFILYSMGKYQLAAKECQLMIILEPNIESYSGYAWLLEQMGKFEESVVQYQELIKLEPDNAIWYYWFAVLLQRCNKYQLSLANFNKCLRMDPHYEGANGNYAYSLYLDEKYQDAFKYIQIALRKESDAYHLCVHYYYALILIQLNNVQTAVNELYLCLELIKQNTNQCKNEKGCLCIHEQDIYSLLHQIGF